MLETVVNGGIMFVEVRFYFRYIYQLCLLSGTLVRYSSCFVRNLAMGRDLCEWAAEMFCR